MFLFAGGGSGGHIAPGIAIAERLIEIAPDADCHFACSARPIDASMLGDHDMAFTPIPAAPFSSRPRGILRFMRQFAVAQKAASELIKARGVTHVVALGGFVAAPVVAAAKKSRIPVTMLNLDTPPGKANKWLARKCETIWTALPLANDPEIEIQKRALPAKFARTIVGLPVRRVAISTDGSVRSRERLGLDASTNTLLVTGASQGATSINRMMIALAESSPELFDGWQVLHIAGADHDDAVRAAYKKSNIKCVVQPYLREMGSAWGAADLAISRAGANSVAEAVTNAVPTIYLPYPYHRDLHQKYNAEPVERIGGGRIVLDQIDAANNVAQITPTLQELMTDSDRRAAMRESLRHHRTKDAAGVIAQMLLDRSKR